MPWIDFSELKRLVPLQQVLDHVGWFPNKTYQGQQRGWCPIHGHPNYKSQSFRVKGDGWYCHVCKDGGDLVRLWCRLTGSLPFPAANDLIDRFDAKAARRPLPLGKAERGRGTVNSDVSSN